MSCSGSHAQTVWEKDSGSYRETIKHYVVIASGRAVNGGAVDTEMVNGERQNVFYNPVSIPVEAEDLVSVFSFLGLNGIWS